MTTYKILVIDDAFFIRNLIKKAVMRKPIKNDISFEIVGEAQNGNEGLKLVKELNPDIITVDFNIPELNGLDFAKYLKETNPHIPILMISSNTDPTFPQQVEEIGCNFLQKPFQESFLWMRLDSLVEEIKNFDESLIQPSISEETKELLEEINMEVEAELEEENIEIEEVVLPKAKETKTIQEMNNPNISSNSKKKKKKKKKPNTNNILGLEIDDSIVVKPKKENTSNDKIDLKDKTIENKNLVETQKSSKLDTSIEKDKVEVPKPIEINKPIEKDKVETPKPIEVNKPIENDKLVENSKPIEVEEKNIINPINVDIIKQETKDNLSNNINKGIIDNSNDLEEDEIIIEDEPITAIVDDEEIIIDDEDAPIIIDDEDDSDIIIIEDDEEIVIENEEDEEDEEIIIEEEDENDDNNNVEDDIIIEDDIILTDEPTNPNDINLDLNKSDIMESNLNDLTEKDILIKSLKDNVSYSYQTEMAYVIHVMERLELNKTKKLTIEEELERQDIPTQTNHLGLSETPILREEDLTKEEEDAEFDALFAEFNPDLDLSNVPNYEEEQKNEKNREDLLKESPAITQTITIDPPKSEKVRQIYKKTEEDVDQFVIPIEDKPQKVSIFTKIFNIFSKKNKK